MMGQFNHPTNVDYDYQIMVTPVTNQQYADYLNQALKAGTVQQVGDNIRWILRWRAIQWGKTRRGNSGRRLAAHANQRSR